MRIPGALLRTPITWTPSLGNTGDGPVDGTPVAAAGVWSVNQKLQVADPADTALVVGTLLVGPEVDPALGDKIAVGNDTYRVRQVAAVLDPGGRVMYRAVVLA